MADGPATTLSGEFEHDLRPGEPQDRVVDKRIVYNDVCLAKRVHHMERQETGIAWPGAGQPYLARKKARQAQRGKRGGTKGRFTRGLRH